MSIDTAPPPKYRRGTYVRCMESDELCRVWTTSIGGGAWVKWPDGSITTYTAEQMGQAFSLEQTAPGKPAGYLKNGELLTSLEIINSGASDAVPLYEHPRQWIGLTTQEILDIVDDHTEIRGSLPMLYRDQAVDLARDIEAKLKDRNAY